MADHGTVVRGIDYKATFPFIHLFRGFRLAIDPTKIAMAMAALILLYLGGRVLDAVWPQNHRAVTGELAMYSYDSNHFRAQRDRLAARRTEVLQSDLKDLGHADWKPTLHNVKTALEERRNRQTKAAHDIFDALPAGMKSPAAQNVLDGAVRSANAEYAADLSSARQTAGQGLFIHFLVYEIDQVDNLVLGAVNLQPAVVVTSIRNFFITAPAWAFIVHPIFFILFFLWLLLIGSIFGGGITRVAAVQVARDEKISIRQALRFSSGKVLSFIFAPLIPLIIIGVLGLILAAVTCLISLPGIGGIWSVVVGVLFFLAILAGLVMMLTAFGLIGGGNLMYPTIAAEGSDSFDAVSRSFSYIYARPWQVAFYSAVAIIYGAITYLFVRLAIYVLLRMVHGSIDMFQWGTAADGTPIFDAMWPMPNNFMKLSFASNTAVLGPVQSVGAFFISLWVWLTIALLGAYAISLYFSESTIIYYLLRKDVDATEMDDVYLEPSDEELSEVAPAETAEATATVTTATVTTVTATEPAGQPIDVPAPPVSPQPDTPVDQPPPAGA